MNTVERLATLERIRKFSRLLDTAFRIPGTPFRIGWDPIIGLIPGLGDLIDTAFSTYLLFLAAKFGLPRNVLGWMVFNISVEAVVGTVPLIGDVFDAFFKSNIRNLVLLEKHLQVAQPDLSELDPLNLSSASTLNPSGT